MTWVARVIALGCLALPLLGEPAGAVEATTASPLQGWAGLYLGGHFGYGDGSFGPGTNPQRSEAGFLPPTLTGFVGGYQAGYNVNLSREMFLGVEADISFTSPRDPTEPPNLLFTTTFDYIATARGRFGYAVGGFLPYVTGGAAWARTRVSVHDAAGDTIALRNNQHVGWVAGAGVESPLTGAWTAKLEYNYIDLGAKRYAFDIPGPPSLLVDPRIHLVKLGLNYHLNGASSDSASRAPAMVRGLADSGDWSIHGQTTLLPQGYSAIRSPYEGANSLPGAGQVRHTWTTTAFIGRRLWDGGEVYLNPELAQGFGLAGTLGLGGFSNGEAQKAGATYPKIRAQRYFFRQTFGLGGEQETVEDGPNQIAGERDIDRITVTVGRIAIGDIFDNNTYAHDPRADFMNWAVWSSAAYDFPADLPGFTRGVVVELNRKAWAIRAGAFQVPDQPNSDRLVFKTGGTVAEFEGRYAVSDQPGKVRLGVFANRGRTGDYGEAVALTLADPTLDINDVMASLRRERPKTGFYVNLEQAVSQDLGVFGRASWNDGRNQILSFTDIDRSVSTGLSLRGSAWGRPADRIGVAAAINGLSSPHRDFLAAGGLGLLIGDGALNYREEKIVETYYAVNLAPWATLSLDYQYIVNPAYNADRGPVSIFAARLHAEF